MIIMNIPTINDPIMTLVCTIIVIMATLIITKIIARIMNKMERFKEDKTAMYLITDIIDYVIYFIDLK